MDVELISRTEGRGRYQDLKADEIVSAIARHGTIKEDGGRLIRYLMDNAHWSPLQHVSYGFRIETRRSISAQIFRHRSLNGQEWSLRYAEPLGFEEIDLRMEHPTNRQSSTESFDPTISRMIKAGGHGMPSELPMDIKASELIKNHLVATEKLYNDLLEVGVAKECARDVLPLCTKTTIHITGTLRDLLGFLNVRCEEHTQLEARLIANRIGEELEKELPDVFAKIDWRNGMFM